VYVAAGIEQRAGDLEVALGGSPMQRVGVVSGLARVRIGAVLEQQPDGLRMSGPGCLVQSGPPLVMRVRVGCASER